MNKCNSDTVVITNLSPLPPFTAAIGKGIYPDIENIQDIIRKKTSRLIAFDAAEIAISAGTVMSVNMVLLGALIQTGLLPFSTDDIKAAIEKRTKKAFAEINRNAFDLGFAAAQNS